MNKLFESVETLSPYTTRYTFAPRTAAGETLVVDFVRCESTNSAGDLAHLWHKNGYTSRVLPTHWAVSTYATDANGQCWGRYNPTVKPNTHKLDFACVLEATEENRIKLLNEIMRRAGLAPHIVTRTDWTAAGTLEKAMQPGDYVATEIVDELRDALPPKTDRRDLFQLGEPADFLRAPATGEYRAVYTTFARDELGWRYCGRCFAGQREEVECNA